MSVVYTRSDSVGRKIIPAPLISITKNYDSNDDGTKRGTTYAISLQGTLLPYRGSPSGNYSSLDTAFWNLGGQPPDQAVGIVDGEPFDLLLRKQEALRWLFSEDGGTLEWQPAGGQPPVRCYPTFVSIDFTEGQWASRSDYTIELEAPWIFINGTLNVEDSFSMDLVSSSAETWTFEEIDGRNSQQHRVSHEVTANSKIGYDGVGGLHGGRQAWENAKIFVDARISGVVGSDVMFAALGSTSKIAGRYSTTINIDKGGGTYGITEEWLLSDSGTYEERQFTVEYDGRTDEYGVTYQGTILGVSPGSRDGNVSSLNTAKTGIPSDVVAQATATANVSSLLNGKSIPVSPDRRTFVLNQQDGSVVFTFQWNTSDNSTVSISEEAQHSDSKDSRLNTLTHTRTIEGKGSTRTERLTNAKSGVVNDVTALASAKTLASTSLNYFLVSVVKSFDDRSGIIRVSRTWTDRDANSTEVNIQKQESVPVLAIIPIPGRAAGPIVQNMTTVSSEIITVSIRSKRNVTQPTLNTVVYGEGGTIISDNNNWNPNSGLAERTTRFLKES